MEDFGKHKPPEPENQEDSEFHYEFKPFEKTFKFITFMLSAGMIYPNPATEKWRLLAIPISWSIVSPAYILFGIDMYNAWKRDDLDTVFRHIIIMGPFTGQYVKMPLMYFRRHEARELLDEYNRDYEIVNTLPVTYKKIAKKWVDFAKLYEKLWSAILIGGSYSFPIAAVVVNSYNFMFKENPKRYLYEVRLPFRLDQPDLRLETPYFEFMFCQLVICSTFYLLNFSGFDGLMIVSIFHSCFKVDMCVQALKDAFKLKDLNLIKKQIGKVIYEQNRLYKHVDVISATFNVWFAAISCYMVLHFSICTFHLAQLSHNDVHDILLYSIGTVSTLLYVYTMCCAAGMMKDSGILLSNEAYACGWEAVYDTSVRRVIAFIIARSQQPLRIKALSYYDIDMEFFSKIIKMAYSTFTLLQQK